MKPWILLDVADVPGEAGDLKLYRRGEEFSIKAGLIELMNSRMHGSEDALAELGCSHMMGTPGGRVLVGGLGLGFTLAAALRAVGPHARVEVAELVPQVVAWNREYLGELAGHPLRDPRVVVREGDVAALLRGTDAPYDAILLDVDNGPQGLILKRNDWLYDDAGLAAARRRLAPGGVLAVWSASPDRNFVRSMRRAGFDAREEQVRARPGKSRITHLVWVGRRTAS